MIRKLTESGPRRGGSANIAPMLASVTRTVNRKDTMKLRNAYGFKGRAWVAGVTVLSALLIFVLLATAAKQDCSYPYLNTYESCMSATYTTGPKAGQYVYTLEYCAKKAKQALDACNLANNAGGTKVRPYPSPPPLPIIHRPPVGAKPIHPVSGPITNKSPTPTPAGPTLLSKSSKPTPTPHTEHHHHP